MNQNIQKLPDGWRWVKLGDVCEFQGGMQPPKSVFIYQPLSGYLRLVQIQDFRLSNVAVYIPKEEAKRTFDETDVMIGRYGPPVFQILRGLSGAYNVALIKTIPKENLLKDYLYYLLKEPSIQKIVIEQSQRTAGQSGVQKSFLETLLIPLPPLAEQKRIAAILNEQMAAVEEARKAAESQLEAAEELPKAYLREVFESEEAQNWAKKSFRELCKKDGQYGTSEKANELDQGLPILRMSNLVDGQIHWNNLKFIKLPDTEEKKYTIKKYDILFNRTNSVELVGKTAVFDGKRQAVFASYLVKFEVIENIVDPYYICYYINSCKGKSFIQANLTRAIGQANISASIMHKMPIPFPPLAEQKRIVAYLTEKLRESDRLKQTIREQLKAIKQLPSALLQQAFNGDV